MFDAHINSLCTKISKSLYILNRVKNFLPKSSLVTLYYTLIHCHLLYCANIYGSATQTSLKKLFLKQKQSIRTITKSTYRANTAPLFKQLKILPLNELIIHSQLKFMHDFTFNKLPFSFQEMWITNRMRNPLVHLRNSDNLYIIPHRFESIKRLPLFKLPKIWNEEDMSKLNPVRPQYLKSLKSRLLNGLN